MATQIFGQGRGHLPTAAARIAREHGAELVNTTDPLCACGRGCRPSHCKAARRHWFTTEVDCGPQFVAAIARGVYAACRSAGIDLGMS